MIFSVTLYTGQNSTLDYDKTGKIVSRDLSSSLGSFEIPPQKVGKISVLKDPVINNVNMYILELYDLPLDVVLSLKQNLIYNIYVRIGNGLKDGVPNYDLMHWYLRPIVVYEQDLQKDNILNDIVVKCVSLTTNAILVDSSLSGEMKLRNDSSVSYNAPVKNGNIKIDSTKTQSIQERNANNDILNNLNLEVNLVGQKGLKGSWGWLANRNNNLGNIRSIQSREYVGEVTGANDSFEVFATPVHGVMGMAQHLAYRYINNGYDTIDKIISRWAPRNGKDPKTGASYINPTDKYIASVAQRMGKDPNDKITEADLANLVISMGLYEGARGDYYTPEIVNLGLAAGGFNSKVNNSVYGKQKSIASVPDFYQHSLKTASLNTFDTIKGDALLENILTRISEKYKVLVNRNLNVATLRSNFVYPNVYIPGLTTFEILKKIHKEYPSYLMEVPWILDDTPETIDETKLGKTWYTEIAIMNVNALPVKSIYKSEINGEKSIAYNQMVIKEIRPYYTETIEKIEATRFNHKNLFNGVVTVIEPKNEMGVAKIPDPNANTPNSVSFSDISIKNHKNLTVETNFDSSEFLKRLELYKKHVASNPQIIRSMIKINDPHFIQFGYAYTFDDQQLNKITPYKILMEFVNVQDELQLTWSVDFYKGIDMV